MNQHYLMEYISRRLHTLIRCYSPSWELTEAFCAREDLQDDSLEAFLRDWFSAHEAQTDIPLHLPVFLHLNKQAVYARIPAGENIFLVGPVAFSSPVNVLRHATAGALNDSLLLRIPVCDFQEFMAEVLLLANLYSSHRINEEAVISENCIDPRVELHLEVRHMEHTFENREAGRLHNPYDQELREFTSIEKGNIEELQNSLSEDYPGEIGRLAKTPLRHMKNRGIVVVALASRAAIRGGILPEAAYSLSDSYIQKIEDCSDIPTVLHLFHTAEYHYAGMVRDCQKKQPGQKGKQSNQYIEKCKTYIFSHLHGKICVKDIAEYLNINANYLSQIFHECEGQTITQYIHNEKINLTKNLLTYSQYTYSEIASYLGYSSQSHLGRQFKQRTGMTMCEYRSKYGAKY